MPSFYMSLAQRKLCAQNCRWLTHFLVHTAGVFCLCQRRGNNPHAPKRPQGVFALYRLCSVVAAQLKLPLHLCVCVYNDAGNLMCFLLTGSLPSDAPLVTDDWPKLATQPRNCSLLLTVCTLDYPSCPFSRHHALPVCSSKDGFSHLSVFT